MGPDLSRQNSQVVSLPKVPDARGNLTFLEGGGHVPFDIARVYWIYAVPGGAWRGGHALKTTSEMLIALSGSFDVMVDDGESRFRHTLNRGYLGLLVPAMTWRTVENFSTNAVCLCVASGPYDEDDYIRDYADFVAAIHR